MKHFICMLIVLIMLIPAACAAALLSEEEVIQIAKEEYPKSAQKMGWPLLDLDSYDTECRKMKNPDGTTTWDVRFLSPEYDVPFAECRRFCLCKPQNGFACLERSEYVHS